MGNFEIHTATFPRSSASTVPFITTRCEVAGPDPAAMSPADCAAPTDFQIAFNSTAGLPTPSSSLNDPSTFVNSGVITWGTAKTFVADQPGTYRFVCLVHGPSMSGTVRVWRAERGRTRLRFSPAPGGEGIDFGFDRVCEA